MRLFDAHAHLGDEEELLSRKRENISSLVCAGTPEEAERLMLLCEHSPFSPILLPALGLHPWQAGNVSFRDMEPWLLKAPVIGEIGMDSVWCDVPLSKQEKVFCAQLELASALKKPVVLHTKGQEKRSRVLSETMKIPISSTGIPGRRGSQNFWSLTATLPSAPMSFIILLCRGLPGSHLKTAFLWRQTDVRQSNGPTKTSAGAVPSQSAPGGRCTQRSSLFLTGGIYAGFWSTVSARRLS